MQARSGLTIGGTWAYVCALAALPALGCGDDNASPSTLLDADSGDESDDPRANATGEVASAAIAEWTDVHDVQVIDRPDRVEVWARNVRREVIGKIVVENDGSWVRVSSEYADGGFAVEVAATTSASSYDVVFQTLEDDELLARAAAIEDVLYEGAGPQDKWLACGVFATSVIPACLGAWAAIACIPATVVASCKCIKAALDLPNEQAGICENI